MMRPVSPEILVGGGLLLSFAGFVTLWWISGQWMSILLAAWVDTITDPIYRHDNWVRVDIIGNLTSFFEIVFSNRPLTTIGSTMAIFLGLTGIISGAWGWFK